MYRNGLISGCSLCLGLHSHGLQGDSEMYLQLSMLIKRWELLSLCILVDFTHRLDNIVVLKVCTGDTA